jgi:hypothetical protein
LNPNYLPTIRRCWILEDSGSKLVNNFAQTDFRTIRRTVTAKLIIVFTHGCETEKELRCKHNTPVCPHHPMYWVLVWIGEEHPTRGIKPVYYNTWPVVTEDEKPWWWRR